MCEDLYHLSGVNGIYSINDESLLMASQARWFQDEPIDPVFEGIAGALNRWTWLPG